MKLIYLGHSGFALEGETIALVTDYCAKLMPKPSQTAEKWIQRMLGREFNKKIYVLSSHAHGDHFDPDVLSWRAQKEIRYILSGDIGVRGGDVALLNKGDSYQDPYISVKAFGSTDIGVSFFLEAEDRTIFHAGDLNNWHWNEEQDETQALLCERHFLCELDEIAKAVPALNVLMFPVDPRLGRDYLRGPAQFIEKIPVKLFVPMHFWNNHPKAAAFALCAKERGVRFVVLKDAGAVCEIDG